jgi:dihydroorotate dehydrogenase (NAD+) catalytic subunit
MKPKRRVVTHGKGPGPKGSGAAGTGGQAGRSKRTPTVRTIRSAIVEPTSGRSGGAGAAGAGAEGARAAGAGAGGARSSPIVALGSPTIAPPAPGGGRAGPPSGFDPSSVDLAVDLGRGLVLANPILVASGTFGYGVEYADVVDIQRIGAICCKGTTLRPRAGNRPPRVTETPGGMLNSIGLQNPGIDAVLERYAPLWATWEVPVIVNVAGESIEDYVGVVRKLDLVPGVAGVELNISCPNVGKGGLQFAIDQDAAAAVTRAVRRATDLPLIVKLSPNVSDIRPIARAVADAGADALSAVNTLSGMALRADRTGPFLGNTYGGLSGPAIKPVALRIVYEIAQVVEIPIIAIGGVTGLDDVLDYLAAGAIAVQAGTAIFADPTLPVRLVDELAAECGRRGLASYGPLVGTALPRRPGSPSAKGVEYRP